MHRKGPPSPGITPGQCNYSPARSARSSICALCARGSSGACGARVYNAPAGRGARDPGGERVIGFSCFGLLLFPVKAIRRGHLSLFNEGIDSGTVERGGRADIIEYFHSAVGCYLNGRRYRHGPVGY